MRKSLNRNEIKQLKLCIRHLKGMRRLEKWECSLNHLIEMSMPLLSKRLLLNEPNKNYEIICTYLCYEKLLFLNSNLCSLGFHVLTLFFIEGLKHLFITCMETYKLKVYQARTNLRFKTTKTRVALWIVCR